MKLFYSGVSIGFTFLSLTCLQSTNVYGGGCFSSEIDPRVEYREDALTTKSIRIRQSIPEDRHGRIVPKTYDDGSQTTPYTASSEPLPIGALFGSDDRVRVQKTTNPKYRVHGRLEMTFPNGEQYVGSGTMVNHRHVLTAGHCLYDIETEQWATSIKFTAAKDGNSSPISPAYATHLVTVKGWKDYKDSKYDMGMLILNRDVGEETGWFGLSTDTDSTLKRQPVNVTGYPGEKMFPEMWTMSGSIQNVTEEQFTYTLDTTGGQSGSGVWTQFSNIPGYYCVGIHTSGIQDQYNTATRISRGKFNSLVSWINRSWQ